MINLRGRQDSQYVNKILNWKLVYYRTMHRLYLEYCPFGSGLALVDHELRPSRTHAPEPFLWHLFECLAKVAMLMEYGEPERNPMSEWEPIVHRDLKLGNLFFSAPDASNFCKYPTPKVGDWGAALLSSHGPIRATDSFPLGVSEIRSASKDTVR